MIEPSTTQLKETTMKPSHTQTPRTLADCTFVQGYKSIHPMSHKEATWEFIGGYLLATAIGVSMAACLFYGWSA